MGHEGVCKQTLIQKSTFRSHINTPKILAKVISITCALKLVLFPDIFSNLKERDRGARLLVTNLLHNPM